MGDSWELLYDLLMPYVCSSSQPPDNRFRITNYKYYVVVPLHVQMFFRTGGRNEPNGGRKKEYLGNSAAGWSKNKLYGGDAQ